MQKVEKGSQGNDNGNKVDIGVADDNNSPNDTKQLADQTSGIRRNKWMIENHKYFTLKIEKENGISFTKNMPVWPGLVLFCTTRAGIY